MSLKLAAKDTRPQAFVFPTSRGGPLSPANVRGRIMRPAVAAANERLGEDDQPELPAGLTPHGLRRTFASVLYAIGEPPPVVMAEMGHTDPALALRIYAKAMRRDPGENERLRALVGGAVTLEMSGAPEFGDVPSSALADRGSA